MIDFTCRFSSQSPPRFATNMLYFSPWTGEVWARLHRGGSEWTAWRVAAEGERSYSDRLPGSLVVFPEQIFELPTEALKREFYLFTSAIANGTISDCGEIKMTNALMDLIAGVRVKVENGTVTDAELREVYRAMREDRMNAGRTSAASKARKATIDPNEALAAFLGTPVTGS